MNNHFSQQDKVDLSNRLAAHLGRPPSSHEVINGETDALLMIGFLVEKVGKMEARINALEKGKQQVI